MESLDGYKIKIFTRSMNYELYCYSQHLITLPYKRVRMTRTTADGYLYKIMGDSDCDIAINIDEDAFVLDEQAIVDLTKYVVDNEYANAGMADGGQVILRGQNPIVTNPFFNVFNLRQIRTKYSKKDVLLFNYFEHVDELKAKLPHYLQQHNRGLDSISFEPYYQFFFWLAYNFKTLYLPAKQHDDKYSTILMNQNHKPILLHTWFSREYNIDSGQTIRIKSRINEISQRRYTPVKLSAFEKCICWIDPYYHVFLRKCNTLWKIIRGANR